MYQEEKERPKVFRINLFKLLISFAIWTLIFFIILWAFERPIQRTLTHIAMRKGWFVLSELTQWTYGLLVAAILSAIVAFFRIKRVLVWKDRIEVKGAFLTKRAFDLKACAFEGYEKLSDRYVKRRLLFLKVTTPEGKDQKIRLSFFSSKGYSLLLSSIRAGETEAIPKETRQNMVYEDILAGEILQEFPKESVIEKEWKRFGIFVGISIALFIIIFLMRSIMGEGRWYFLMTAVSILVISIPIEAIRVWINKRRCPQVLRKYGSTFYFDKQGFSTKAIDKIVMTDKEAESNSIYPKNRFIKVYSQGKKYCYYLGSTYSLEKEEYGGICESLERLFVNDAVRVVYDRK